VAEFPTVGLHAKRSFDVVGHYSRGEAWQPVLGGLFVEVAGKKARACSKQAESQRRLSDGISDGLNQCDGGGRVWRLAIGHGVDLAGEAG
jgi:hypothetical protein